MTNMSTDRGDRDWRAFECLGTDKTGYKVLLPISATKQTISAETVNFAAGVAGTTGIVCLNNTFLYDASGALLGKYGNTSFSWVTGTVLTTEVAFDDTKTDAEQLALLSNGEYAINYSTGIIRYKKATNGTSDTCNYIIKRYKVDTELEASFEIEEVTIENIKVYSPDGTAANTKYGFAMTDGGAADGTKHWVGIGAYDAGNSKFAHIRAMKGDAAANSGYHLSVAGEVVDFDTTAGTDFTPAIGILAASASGALPIRIYAEDAAHASSDYGTFVLAVRNDNNTGFAGTDGDYIPFSTTSNGSVWVRDDQWGQHDATVGSLKGPIILSESKDFDNAAFPNPVGTEGDAVRPAASLYGVSYNMLVSEDGSKTVHATDDSAQVVTPDFINVGGEYRAAATTYTDGDATILQTDINGYLKVTQANTEYTDDSNGFTIASSKGNAFMALATTDAVDSGDIGALKMDTLRQLATGIYDAVGTRLDILTQDSAFGTTSKGLAIFGKYEATPTTYTDGDACPILLDANGRIVLSSDIEIGAVELKDGTTDNRVEIKAPNTTAIGYGMHVMPARYLATPVSITDTFSSPLLLGSKAQLLTNLYDGTNTNALQLIGALTYGLGVGVFDATGNRMPTMDTNTRPGFVKITDGAQEWSIDVSGYGQIDIAAQSLTALKVSKDANANLVTNAIFCQLSDQTTGVGVIAATTALKTDTSSIAGTATAVNSGNLDNGTQRVAIATNDVNVSAMLTSLQLIDDAIWVDDAAFTVATSKGIPAFGLYKSTEDVVDDGDVGALSMTSDRHLKVRPDSYDIGTDSLKTSRVDDLDGKYVVEQLASVTNGTDGTYYYYLPMNGYRYLTTQFIISGGSGTCTLTLEGTAEASTAPESCTYTDVTLALTGSASFTASNVWIIDTAISFRYLRVKVVASTGGANDADWTINSKRMF